MRRTLRLWALGLALALLVERGALGGGWIRLPHRSEHQCGCLRCSNEATCCCALQEPGSPWRMLACDASSEGHSLLGNAPAVLPHVPQVRFVGPARRLPKASWGLPSRNVEPLEPPPRLL